MLSHSKPRIEPFGPQHVAAVRAFNQRLGAGGISWRFPERWVPDWLPNVDGARVYQEFFLLLEGEDVRGAYALKHQDVSLSGEIQRVGSFYLPLSEGVINPAYGLVASRLLQDAMRRVPLLYSVGMGGRGTQVARLVRAIGWPMQVVPFYFKVRHGSRFLREVRYLRRGRWGAALLDLAAASGIGALAARVADLALTRWRTDPAVHVDAVDEGGDWLDALWRSCAARYSFAAVRDGGTLDQVYPAPERNSRLLRISRGGHAIGLAVVRDAPTSFRDSKYFGDLQVGTIVDGVAAPDHADVVVERATRQLEERGVDLLVSNQLHPAWRTALRRAGFIRGPSNFLFATSPALAQRLRARDPLWRAVHVNRGDGDAPWPGDRATLENWHEPFSSGIGP